MPGHPGVAERGLRARSGTLTRSGVVIAVAALSFPRGARRGPHPAGRGRPSCRSSSASSARPGCDSVGSGSSTTCSTHSLSLPELAAHQRAGRIWVAVGADERPLGFAVASVLDGAAHLEELDVRARGRPSRHRHGGWSPQCATGRQRRASRRSRCPPSATCPWNAPFYDRLGFRPLGTAELSPALREVRAREEHLGIAIDQRVIMRRELPRRPDAPPLHLVLYDGECGVCSRIVRWLLGARSPRACCASRRSRARRPRRSGRRCPALPDDLDSIIYVDRSSGVEHVSWRSEAFFRLCRLLGGPWRVVVGARRLAAALARRRRLRRVRAAPPSLRQSAATPARCRSSVERARFLP